MLLSLLHGRLTAATCVWDGGTGRNSTALEAATNWSGNTLPTSSSASSDIARWDGSASGHLFLTNNNNALFNGGPAGSLGLTLSLTASQTGHVSFYGSTFRILRIDLEPGAGAFTCESPLTISGLSSANTIPLTNNSANPATLHAIAGGGGGLRTLAVSGSGDWAFNGTIGNANGGIAIQKYGTGTLTISAANNNNEANLISGGLVIANHPSAVGGTGGTLMIAGGGASSQLRLVGLSYALSPIVLSGRNSSALPAHILHAGGESSLPGNIALNTGGSRYMIESAQGLLRLGQIVEGSATGSRHLFLQGAGKGTVEGIDPASHLILYLYKLGPGNWTLIGTNGYTGPTTITAGTLALGSGSAIDRSAQIVLSAGATLDVSALPDWLLGTNSTLVANGRGTNVGTTAACIKGGTTVDLGAQPLTLDYDGVNPSLFVPQGTLLIRENAFVVNTPAPLAPGDYTLIQQTGGNISSLGRHSVGGTAIEPGKVGLIVVQENQVCLRVVQVATITVETAADGTGTVVPAQFLETGVELRCYAIARAADGSFLANVPAAWSFVSYSGTVGSDNLLIEDNGKSARLSAYRTGTASLRAVWAGISSEPIPVPVIVNAQKISETIFALSAAGASNRSYNVLTSSNISAPLLAWPMAGRAIANAQGQIDFVAFNATNQEQFYALGVPSGADSGLITIIPGETLYWSDTPENYRWDTSSVNWLGRSPAFSSGCEVELNDFGSATTPISLVGNLAPGKMVVNASRNYILNGDGFLSGTGSVVKAGSGTLTIANTAPNTYTGGTTISTGTLLVNGTLGSDGSGLTVLGGMVGGSGVILSPVQISTAGSLSPGETGIGKLTVSNSVSLRGQTIMQLTKSGHTNDVLAANTISYGGTLIVSNLAGTLYMGDCFTLFDASSYSGTFESIIPATPGNGLVWETNSLAKDGTLLVMGANVTTDTYAYSGYNIRARSRFNAYNSLVNRPYPLYDYSVNVLKLDSSYLAVTGDRYTGAGEDGDHIFGWLSTTGQPDTWTNLKSSGMPLFLQADTFGANTMDPELIFNPADATWYMYVQRQRSGGDRIMALTSKNLVDWVPLTERSVITNIPTGTFYFHHHEVIYVPWSSQPFWLYVDVRESGVEKAYKLIKSTDPLAFDYAAQIDSGGERNLGGQRGYLLEAPNGPLFIRITTTGVNGKDAPILQFSNNGTSWTYGGNVVLAGSSNTGNYSNCYFPGISTIKGNGALEYLGHNRWRAIYAATTAAAPTSPEIFYSEIGCGEVVIDLN